MDKHLNINDLLSSNFLADNLATFLASGGLLQTSSDQFILFLRGKTPLFQASFGYGPRFWDFLQNSESQNQGLFAVEKALSVTRVELIELLQNQVTSESQQLVFVDDHKNEFESQYAWSQKCFAGRKLKKTVPITKFSYRTSKHFNFADYLYASLQKKREGFLYGMWNGDEGFLGLTPELLASWNGMQITTMALAGTWVGESAKVDQKILEEHNFVITDICERLGQADVSETQILKLPKLNHLKTEIRKNCSDQDEFLQIVQKLHPTAALGIYPRLQHLAEEFSQFPLQKQRQYFGAPFGIIGQNFAHVVVGIRNMSWKNNTINLFAGCGITAQSQFEVEWQELQTKRDSICEAFSLHIPKKQGE